MRRRLVVLAVFLTLALTPALAGALPSMPSSKFGPSAGCGCHATLLEQWRVSMHAQALSDPLYQYKLGEALEATDGQLADYCNACHSPIAVMAGEVKGTDLSGVSPQGLESVVCDMCHQVAGTEGPKPGNTSLKITGDGIKLAQLKDPQAPHAAAYSQFHETAEFCGNCHDVDHPGNGMHLEATYTEWKNGPYAAEGIVCQDCHMTPGAGVTKPNPGKAAGSGPEREHIYIMTFAGGNVGLGDAARAEERLKAAATVDLELPEIVASGDVALTSTITNVGAGHYLPTGLTEVRQMWLEVVATDADGTELMKDRHDFGSVLKNEEGEYPVELWEAVDFQSDDRIPPKGSVSDDWAFPMGIGPVTVTATLYYRSCSEEMAEGAGVDIPTTTMASASKRVFVSTEQKAEDATAEPATPDAEEPVAGGSGATLPLLIGAGVVAAGAAAFFFMKRGKR